jgi:hypothetical protein
MESLNRQRPCLRGLTPEAARAPPGTTHSVVGVVGGGRLADSDFYLA